MLDIPSYILGKKSGGSSQSEEEYSTTEQKIGKWIDEKPLYQKVIQDTFPEITDGTQATKSITIAENIDTVFIKTAWFYRGTSPYFKEMLPYIDTNFNDVALRIGATPLSSNSTKLVAFGSSALASEKNFTAVVCYTKTTD